MNEIDPKTIYISTYRDPNQSAWALTADNGVRVHHVPTGIVTSCHSERSQHANRNKAMEELKRLLEILHVNTSLATIEDIQKIGEQYGYTGQEIEHAFHSLGAPYGEEIVVELKNGFQLHSPIETYECNYVRLTHFGLELAYWHYDEWETEPKKVMSVIMLAAKRR